MIKIKQLDHVVLRSNNVESQVKFYTEVLGCVIERESSAELGLIQLRAGRSLIDIVAVSGTIGILGGRGPGLEGHNMDHFCVRLENFDEAAIRKHLLVHGIDDVVVERRYGAEGIGPSIYIKDPEGNSVELKGPAEGSQE